MPSHTIDTQFVADYGIVGYADSMRSLTVVGTRTCNPKFSLLGFAAFCY